MHKALVLAIVGAIAVGIVGCSDPNGPVIPPGFVSETRELGPITRFAMRAIGDVNVTESETSEVKVTIEEELLQYMRTDTSHGYLYIDVDPAAGYDYHLTVDITGPDLEVIYLYGIGTIRSTNTLVGEHFGVVHTGIGDIILDVQADRLNTSTRGVGTIRYSGIVDYHSITVESVSKLESYGLVTGLTDIRHRGVENAYVRVNDQLSADIRGTGSVYYKGNPDLQIQISGPGNVINDN